MKTSFIAIIAVLTATISKAFGAAVNCCECKTDLLEVAKAGVVFGVIGIPLFCSPIILELLYEWYIKYRSQKSWKKWEEERKEREKKFYEEPMKR